MYKWNFTMSTLEKGNVSLTIKASNKDEAIRKGFAKIESKGLSVTPHWNCALIRNF